MSESTQMPAQDELTITPDPVRVIESLKQQNAQQAEVIAIKDSLISQLVEELQSTREALDAAGKELGNRQAQRAGAKAERKAKTNGKK